jgi:hypothetical protein
LRGQFVAQFPPLAFMPLLISAGVPADPLGSWFVSLTLLSAFDALWHVTECSVLRAQFLATSMTVQQ